MPRAKRESDELYNARRRAKRALERTKKKAGSLKGAEKAAFDSYVRDVSNDIANSYVSKKDKKGKVQKQTVSKAIETARTAGRKTFSIEQGFDFDTSFSVGDRAFRREMNKASAGKASIIAKNPLTANIYVKIFYAATVYLWEKEEPENRLEAIVKGLGTDSLSEAFSKVIRENREAANQAKALNYLTNDNPNEDFASPPPLGYIEKYYR